MKNLIKETWHYLSNQFDNVTKKSFKLMNIINADHLAKLQAQASDTVIATLLARTNVPHDSFNTTYSNWLSAKGFYKGETNRVNGYLKELSSVKLKQWDAQIQAVYLEGTPDYKILLPNGRKPFQSGTIDDRISHLQAFVQRLAAYPTLVTTKTNVIAFHTMLNAARDVQQQKEELVDYASTLLEVARKDIALMMYRNLGVLIDKYASNPDFVSNFWDYQLLHSNVSDDEQIISGKITDSVSGTPLLNVTITLIETGESTHTDANGNYILSTIHIGAGALQFVLTNYVTQTIAVNILKDELLVQDVSMIPIIG